MGKIAFVFSGQGAQKAGMGKDFYENNASVKELFARAEEIRPGTLQQCFEGTAEELKITENTQPCLYLADIAAAMALGKKALCLRLWQVFLWEKSPHWLLQAHTALKMGSVWLAREGQPWGKPQKNIPHLW